MNDGAFVEVPLPDGGDVSAVALDALGRKWAGTPGSLWMHDDAWSPAWTDASWTTPFVGIMADVGRLIAVTATGGIVQGEKAVTSRTPQ